MKKKIIIFILFLVALIFLVDFFRSPIVSFSNSNSTNTEIKNNEPFRSLRISYGSNVIQINPHEKITIPSESFSIQKVYNGKVIFWILVITFSIIAFVIAKLTETGILITMLFILYSIGLAILITFILGLLVELFEHNYFFFFI